MKKIYVFTTICSVIFFSACYHFTSDTSFNSEDAVFNDIVNAISDEDSAALYELFSNNVRTLSTTLDSDIEQFIQMFESNIVTYYRAGGSNTERRVEGGKNHINIKSSYIIETENRKYYVVINYCQIDTFDSNNVGLNCINIATDINFQSSSVYRGDGQWSPGITFDTTKYTG